MRGLDSYFAEQLEEYLDWMDYEDMISDELELEQESDGEDDDTDS